jgi:hypothetical protein
VPTDPEQPLTPAETAAILNDPNATADQLAAVARQASPLAGQETAPAPPIPDNPAPDNPAPKTPASAVKHAPRKRIWMIAAGTTTLIAILAIALLTTPLLTWMGVRPTTASSTWQDAPNSSYLNGASQSWTLDLNEVLPGKDASFSFGPNGDDAWHWSRFSPLAVDGKWIAPYTIGDLSNSNAWVSGLLGLDPATGKVLWNANDNQLGECAETSINGALPCLSSQGGASTRLTMVDLSTGSVRDLGVIGNAGGIAVANNNVIAAFELDHTIKISSYATDGTVQWSSELTYADSDGPLIDLSAPVVVSGDYAEIRQMGGDTILRATDGAVALRGIGDGELLPNGVFAANSSFTPTVAATAGLSYHKTAGNVQLSETNGNQFLFITPDGNQSPIQWCPDLDLAKCQQIPNSAIHNASAVTMVNGEPRYFISETDSQLGSYNLSTGASSADLTQIAAPRTTSSDKGNYYTLLQTGQVGVSYDQDSGEVWLFNTVTGAQIAQTTLPGWQPLLAMPADRLVLGYSPDGYLPDTKITMFSPSAIAGSGLSTNTQNAATALPTDAPSCPSDSVQLAFATFTDGWVLVCGVDASTPTQWYSRDSTGRLDSTSVTYDSASNRYTAQFPDGTSGWLNHSPGVYGRTGSGTTVTVQRSVGMVWFVTIEGSTHTPSAGQTTGPYGIPIPQRHGRRPGALFSRTAVELGQGPQRFAASSDLGSRVRTRAAW